MVDIELQANVWMLQVVDDRQAVGSGVDGESGDVVRVDGFDQQAGVRVCQCVRRVDNVVEHGLPGGGRVCGLPDQAVDAWHIESGRILGGELNALTELVDSLGVGGDTAITGDPVTGGEIDQHQICLLYTSPSPRDGLLSRMPSSA